MVADKESLLDRLKRNAAASGIALVKDDAPAALAFDADLVPDAGPPAPVSDHDAEIDRVLDGIDIIDAYRRWCGKMEPKVGSKREGIKVSCPNPDHPDRDPSAWINLDKQVWTCGGCGFAGGDKFDIAAWGLGFPVPGYKSTDQFPALTRAMAAEYGYEFVRTPSGATVRVTTESPAVLPADEPVGGEAAAPSAPTGKLALLPTPQTAFGESLETLPPINWRDILPIDSFLHKWMVVVTKYDLPDEYFFWLGMQALAAACGDDVTLTDQPHIEPNLFVCLYGPSGIGKSRATRVLTDLLKMALPYDADDPGSTGCYLTPMPGSGEALLDVFSKPERDPLDPKKIIAYRQVRALVRFDELASLVGRGARSGSTLKPSVMGLYDGSVMDTTSRGVGVIRAENPYCQMLSTTQPKAIRELLVQNDSDSGFINRWIFAVGQPKRLVAYGREPFDPKPLSGSLQQIRSWASSGRDFTLEGDVLDKWSEFFAAEIEPQKVSDDADPLLARMDLTLMKCMILFTANSRAANPSMLHLDAALSLFPYLTHSYQMLAGEIGLGIIDDCANSVIAAVHELTDKLGRAPAIRDLYDRRLRRRYSREVVLKAVQQLIALGELDETATKSASGKGPASVRYSVVSS